MPFDELPYASLPGSLTGCSAQRKGLCSKNMAPLKTRKKSIDCSWKRVACSGIRSTLFHPILKSWIFNFIHIILLIASLIWDQPHCFLFLTGLTNITDHPRIWPGIFQHFSTDTVSGLEGYITQSTCHSVRTNDDKEWIGSTSLCRSHWGLGSWVHIDIMHSLAEVLLPWPSSSEETCAPGTVHYEDGNKYYYLLFA